MPFPDYYAILGVESNATPDQIKAAYKRKSLISHPDRVPQGPGSDEKRKAATEAFQAIADAYFTLSDPARRSAYDRLRKSQPTSSWSDAPSSSSSFFSDYFSGGAQDGERAEQPDADHVFGNVFEDLLRPEVNRVMPLWTWVGAASGAALGFILGNIPGAALGGFGGSRLGAIRDAKGKSVSEVFMGLAGDQKAQVLQALFVKVFGMAGLGASSGTR